MKSFVRRLLLTVGAVMLVGGWGTTLYAAQHQEISSSSTPRGFAAVSVWDRELRGVYIRGVLGMAVGAGMISFGVWRRLSGE